MARVSATFTEPGSLGLSFEENVARGGAATIREVKTGTQATAHTQLKTGMALVVVGTSRCDGLGYKDIIGLIRGNPGRPLTLTFEEPLPVPCGQYLVDASHDGSAAGIHHCMASGMVYVDSADDFTGNTALMEAAAGGHTECVKILLKNNAQINARCNLEQTALIKACGFGHSGTAMLLINHGAVSESPPPAFRCCHLCRLVIAAAAVVSVGCVR